VFSLYKPAAELMARNNQLDEAITLLLKGIEEIPVERNVFSLYLSAAELMACNNQILQGLDLLREGMRRIPFKYNRNRVVNSALYLCAISRNSTAINLIIEDESTQKNRGDQVGLGNSLLLQINHQWAAAAETAESSLSHSRINLDLLGQTAFCWLSAEQPQKAYQALNKETIPKRVFSEGNPLTWLRALTAIKIEDIEQANLYLSVFLGRELQKGEQATTLTLIKLWFEHSNLYSRTNLGYYFPHLSPSITGFNNTISYVPSDFSLSWDSLIEKANNLGENSQEGLESRVWQRQPLKIFISYAHIDENFKNELIIMMQGMQRRGIVDAWQDRRIEAGDEWYQKIKNAMEECDLALLLVSSDFIASPFINDEELPQLIIRRQQEGMRIIPIIVRPCLWDSEPIIKDLQVLPKGGKPIITYSTEYGERERVWAEIARTLENHAKAIHANRLLARSENQFN
ncbi:MAG: toll/interleukin-1 receptor domain-containing protein, partial [Bacteroidota bacterium]